MVYKCVLNQDGILTGYLEIEDSEVQPGDITFTQCPDLDPGRYRWNGEMFEPASQGQWFVPEGPDSWYAVFRALMYLQGRGGIDFPAPVKQWLRYYYRSFRRQGDPDPGA